MSRSLPVITTLLAVLVLGVAVESRAGDVIVIVHAANSVPTLSLEDVRRMYQATAKFWPSGHRVVLLLPPPEGAAMDALVRNLLAVPDSSAVAGFYLRAIFQGRLSAMPARTSGTGDAVAKVARHKGAIALANRSELLPDVSVRRIEVPGL